MFSKIFLFEIKYRLGRPAVYVYFMAALIFTALSFALGAMPLEDKQFINGPSAITFYVAIMSIMMMMVSSSIMGIPLYRDIEYNTKEYYLSYPITKAGYFWGRFLSSFLFVLIIDSGVLFGVWIGSALGPILGWQAAAHYGPNKLINYLYPFFTIGVPNLFFMSALFFGLVAATRNVKVIYTSGIFLFLGYLISGFFIGYTQNLNIIFLSDPFAVSAIKYLRGSQSVAEKNNSQVVLTGLLLLNRVIWVAVGAVILAYTYVRFNFEKFFSGRRDKKIKVTGTPVKFTLPKLNIHFGKGYGKATLFTFTKIEVLNLVRDTYFWLIIAGGIMFMWIAFADTHGNYWVADWPRTSMLVYIFKDSFLFFNYCIIIFYTGEALHRERTTRYAFINDALPPSDVTLNMAKVISISMLALFLCLVPMLTGIGVQIFHGFNHFNIPLYLQTMLGVVFPQCVEIVMLAFVLHICINNKFAALGVGISFLVLCLLANLSGWMRYHLLLFAYTPSYGISDVDGIGHMIKPITWFNGYWLLFGVLLLFTGYLFYVRGTISSYKERIQLARERFTGRTRYVAYIFTTLFIITAAYNYYNVSYLNSYFTIHEESDRSAETEKKLKHYEDNPVPSMSAIKMHVDIYPLQHQAFFKDTLTLINKTSLPIAEFLLDRDNISDYSLNYNGTLLSYTNPLFLQRGKFNFLKASLDSSAYRLYKLPAPLAPGDTAIAVVNSVKEYKGFQNDMYSGDILQHVSVIGNGLPSLGYDDDDELDSEEDRAKYGLPKKEEEFPAKDSAAGSLILRQGAVANLLTFDVTISVPGNQTAIGPGSLIKTWQQDGRNYFHYTSPSKGAYTPVGIVSGNYAVTKDTAVLGNGRNVGIELYYEPSGNSNLNRFTQAYKDGLKYFSKIFAPYPYDAIRIVESSPYGPTMSSEAGVNLFSERFGWNAHFTKSYQWDYLYFKAINQLCKQWWGTQVDPNHTKGSGVIIDGISKYYALLLMEKRFGKDVARQVTNSEINDYYWGRGRTIRDQNPLLKAERWNEIDNKVGLVLYGLKDFISEDSLNAALNEFYQAFALRDKPPYAGSSDLYTCLKKHVPDSLQYYMVDTWEKITIYDNKIDSISMAPLGNNRYTVTVKIDCEKEYEDSDGNGKPAPMNDYIDIAVFAADSVANDYRYLKPLLLQKIKLSDGSHTLNFIVTGKPARVAIDPYIRLIDRNINNNWRDF